MEEQFKFGDKVVVWNDESGSERLDAYFVAKIDGEYQYIVVQSEKVLLDIKSGNIFASAAYKNCRKANPMQKYEEAISKSGFDNHEVVDIYFNLIEARNAVWEVDDWKPDWDNGIKKHCIEGRYNSLIMTIRYNIARVFSFKTKEISDWFMKKFEKELGVVLENNLM